MRRLLPGPLVELDSFDAYRDQPDRWLRVGMVLSLDGSVTDRQGGPTGLGGDADRQVFRALRAVCDGILAPPPARWWPASRRSTCRRRYAGCAPSTGSGSCCARVDRALAAGMVDAGLADELCLTIGPALIGAGHHTRPFGHLGHRRDLTLTALYEQDGVLLTRYRLGPEPAPQGPQ